jgi:hypothetical protein
LRQVGFHEAGIASENGPKSKSKTPGGAVRRNPGSGPKKGPKTAKVPAGYADSYLSKDNGGWQPDNANGKTVNALINFTRGMDVA